MIFRDSEPADVKCRVGLVFKMQGFDGPEYYILSHTIRKQVSLINLQNGARWRDAVPVKDARWLSWDEWMNVVGRHNSHRFMLLGKASDIMKVEE